MLFILLITAIIEKVASRTYLLATEMADIYQDASLKMYCFN
ncbi:hypothetical protein CZ794_04210 [Psychrobacter sp. JB385]|nr:hypothetical protein CZ794_04210 [Psychrobacter sp. JB385]